MVKVIVGLMGSSVGSGSTALSAPSTTAEYLAAVQHHHVKELDTARVYNAGKSEEMLGACKASETFQVSTKAPAFAHGSLTYDNIIANCNASLKALQQPQVDIYYLHGPDRTVPLEEQCKAIGQLHSEGKFKRFGVSNISDDEVQRIYDICKREGYCLPKVYQGGYNPLARAAEKTLFPLLRELDMSFYAFSPLAGGLLAKKLDDILNPAADTRYAKMDVFGQIYLKDSVLAALAKVRKVAEDEHVPLMEATMRWFMHHSPLGKEDGVILGAASTRQIEESLNACEKGPLSESIAKAWETLWDEVKGDTGFYHS